MAQELDDGKFWLPADFLEDEDEFTDFKSGKPNSISPIVHKAKPNLIQFGSYGTNSDLSSLVESVTVPETDEEDYLKELSRKLAQSTLEDDFWTTDAKFSSDKSARVMVGSPKSTLSGWNQNSSRGSSNCPSPVPTPPLTQQESPWDVLCAAAGEVAKMRMAGNLTPPPPRIPSPNPQFHQIQATQVKQNKYQQFGQQSRVRNSGGNMKPVVPLLSAWPTLQQAQQLHKPQGARAVFVGNLNTKGECAGTGVFLPRQVGAPTHPQKNQGAEMRYRDSVLMTEQRRHPVGKGLWLPEEWTY